MAIIETLALMILALATAAWVQAPLPARAAVLRLEFSQAARLLREHARTEATLTLDGYGLASCRIGTEVNPAPRESRDTAAERVFEAWPGRHDTTLRVTPELPLRLYFDWIKFCLRKPGDTVTLVALADAATGEPEKRVTVKLGDNCSVDFTDFGRRSYQAAEKLRESDDFPGLRQKSLHKADMRGRAIQQTALISLIDPEALIAPDHPIRRIKRMVDEVLRSMSGVFEEMYAELGRPSIPPERLLKAQVLAALYSIRSERQLCERIRFDILFRWFLDLNLDEPVFDATVFTKNRDRLLLHEVAVVFFNKVYGIARKNKWVSDHHFSADGTLIEAWGSMKSFKPKDGSGDDDLNGFTAFKGEKRSNETHRSVTDPDARLARKCAGEVRLCYRMDAMSENRNKLVAAVRVSPASGHTETQGAAANVRDLQRRGIDPRTMGADALYHNEAFIDDMRTMGVTPHPALHKTRERMGVMRTLAYKLSQTARKGIEPNFGWAKNTGLFRRVRRIGIRSANAAANLVMATRNLVRMARLEADYGGRV